MCFLDLDQCFSNFDVHTDSWGVCLCADSDLVGVGESPIFCISNELSSDAAVAGPEATYTVSRKDENHWSAASRTHMHTCENSHTRKHTHARAHTFVYLTLPPWPLLWLSVRQNHFLGLTDWSFILSVNIYLGSYEWEAWWFWKVCCRGFFLQCFNPRCPSLVGSDPTAFGVKQSTRHYSLPASWASIAVSHVEILYPSDQTSASLRCLQFAYFLRSWKFIANHWTDSAVL